MLYTITAVSTEVEDFILELQIESDATFADLHRLLRQTCGWGAGQPSTFFLCDHRWRPERAIPEQSYEDDTMNEVELGDKLEDEGQRLIYAFDPKENRALLLEVTHISYGKHIPEPLCRRQHGLAPALIIEREEPKPLTQEELLAKLNAAALAEDDDDEPEPTDDELFEIEELDLEGFDFTEE